MHKIQIKPLSVNECWRGRRFKTPKYIKYQDDVFLLLPAMPAFPKKAKLSLTISVEVSTRNADVDNICKPFIDILQNKYGFNDRDVYVLSIQKHIVKKGCESICFHIDILES